MDKFDWNMVSDRSKVAVPQVEAVAVYSTTNNEEIVIRQRSSTGEDDHVVIIPRAYATKLIEALSALVNTKK